MYKIVIVIIIAFITELAFANNYSIAIRVHRGNLTAEARNG